MTKRDIDTAALICQLAASSGHGQNICAKWVGIRENSEARRLSAAAYNHVQNQAWSTPWEMRHSWEEINAEAEALLRTGWLP